MSEVLVLGCGYTGRRLASLLLEEGHRVTGTTRDPERARVLERMGVRPLLVDLDDPEGVRRLGREAPDVCFHLAPPHAGGREGDGNGAGEDPRLEGVVRSLRRAPLEAFVHASSTSVYGDRRGAWVDESCVPSPASPAGRARLAAERTLLRCGWSWDCRPRIGRIAGIYGPGRCLRGAIASGRYRLVRGVDPWSNRIHVDDLAAALHAVWRRGENGRIYDLADGNPHRSSEFARLVASLAGLELREIEPEAARSTWSADRLARKLASRRIRARRMREELGVVPRYPHIRQGVPAALAEEAAAEGAAAEGAAAEKTAAEKAARQKTAEEEASQSS